ncbi:4'-phosphopantetheinyl transferase [Escherichia coli]|uniref:4'-phosphopantetheinyl transferase n=1 Tax=Escherichia coli TaxID=562 RepID=A0A377F7C1_ECOLX|nr:4'-phosphopantetheinyl transferase [Escherichia coli]
MNALSGLQNRLNSIYCTILVGLISVAHQAILCLSYVKKGDLATALFLLKCVTRFQNFANNLNRFFLNLLAMFFTEEAFAVDLICVFRA